MNRCWHREGRTLLTQRSYTKVYWTRGLDGCILASPKGFKVPALVLDT
jgi:hypothetical protein